MGLFRDGKLTAKKWKRLEDPFRRCSSEWSAGTHRLDEYMNLIGHPVPRHFGHRQAAARIDLCQESARDAEDVCAFDARREGEVDEAVGLQLARLQRTA